MDDTNNPEQPEQKKSAWDDLADEIGATPSTDALERKRPAVETEFEPVKRPKSAPASQSSDWNALAGELGIELPDTPPPPPPPATSLETAPVEAAPKDEPPRREKAKRPPRQSRGKGGRDKPAPTQGRHDQKERAEKHKGGEEDSLFADLPTIEDGGDDWTSDAPSLDADAPTDAAEAPDSHAEAADLPPVEARDDESVAETAGGGSQTAEPADDLDTDDDDLSSSLTGDAARSAFDALFESGSFASMEVPQAGAGSESPTDADDSSAAPAGGEDAAASSDAPPSRGGWFGFGRRRQKNSEETTSKAKPAPPEETTDEPEDWLGKSATDSAEMAPAEPESGDAGDDEGSGEKTGRRRRRRRRRRPAAKEDQVKSDTIENGRPADEIKSDAVDSAEDDDEDDDEDLVDDDSESDESGGSRRRPVHKNIPTWSDAIGVMVDANLLSRKQSPRDRPSSRGGSGKGRGRGPRRRKKS